VKVDFEAVAANSLKVWQERMAELKTIARESPMSVLEDRLILVQRLDRLHRQGYHYDEADVGDIPHLVVTCLQD
jgi:hypothetical protein